MKVKTDFVTNSSSASYIMSFRGKDDEMDKDDFTIALNSYLELYKRRYPGKLRFWDASKIDMIIKDRIPLFRVVEGTTMHNSSEDIPDWMKTLMIENFVEEDNLPFYIESFEVLEDN